MPDAAILLGRSSNRSELVTDTPIFHALAAAATPIFHEMTTGHEPIHRPPYPPAAVPVPRPRRPQAEPMDGFHRDPLTLPIPIQTRPQSYRPSATMSRPAPPVPAASGMTGAQVPPRARPRFAGYPRSEPPRRTGRHRLITPGSP